MFNPINKTTVSLDLAACDENIKDFVKDKLGPLPIQVLLHCPTPPASNKFRRKETLVQGYDYYLKPTEEEKPYLMIIRYTEQVGSQSYEQHFVWMDGISTKP